MKPAVLVTGGAGFVGSHVADAYIAAGYPVTVLDNLSNGFRENVPDTARFVQADVRSEEAWELLASGEFGILNHQAGQIDVRCSVADPIADANVNILGFLNLLQGACKGKVRRIVFASSGGAIYREATGTPLDESAIKLPVSPYGAAKLASEYYLVAFAQMHGIEAVTLRYCNVYGPRQNPRGEAGVVAIFVQKIREGEPLVVYGDGEQTRDMVYVEYVAVANVAAGRCPPPRLYDLDRCAYNIGTGTETSVNQLATLLSAMIDGTPQIRHAPERQGEIRRNALACDKAARELGWRPQTSLVEGLRLTLSWLAQD